MPPFWHLLVRRGWKFDSSTKPCNGIRKKIQFTGPKFQDAIPHHGWDGLGSTDRRLREYESYFAVVFFLFYLILVLHLFLFSWAKLISASGIVTLFLQPEWVYHNGVVSSIGKKERKEWKVSTINSFFEKKKLLVIVHIPFSSSPASGMSFRPFILQCNRQWWMCKCEF